VSTRLSTLVVELSVHGSFTIEMPRADADKLIKLVDQFGHELDVDVLPLPVNWEEVIDSGDIRVEGAYIKARDK